MTEKYRLRVSRVTKLFPGVVALDKIDFSVKAGSVHVLCGENGAGKSTLMKIINGVYQADAGQIFIDERPVRIGSPADARRLGISMIFQELSSVPELTVAENLFLGEWPTNAFGKVDWKQMREKTRRLLRQEGLGYSPDTKLRDLTVSDVQMLEIIKAVSRNSRVVIMDEPTSAITQREVAALFDKIQALKARGVSIIYISHKLDEIFRIADEITVFRDGRVVSAHPAAELNIDAVISMMVGRKLENSYPKEPVPLGEVLLEVEGLCGDAFQDVSFHVRRGEIVGFAGLMGAGRTEVMRAVFGLDVFQSGTVKTEGKPVRVRGVSDSIRSGIAMLSEDRRRYGIVPVRSVRENCTLANLKRVIHGGRLHVEQENKLVGQMFDRMSVKTPSFDTPIQALSGGNQQKVLLAKWMLLDPDILILDEPTRGIDVGAKYEIYRLMMELAKEGKAIVMVSSELPELLGMCDRVYVMRRGSVAGELKKEEFSQELIMKYAATKAGDSDKTGGPTSDAA
ncbi:MAG: sugar ABC transporter ATP-binding protein [Synergistaceae bacterium]|jgi:inositol transport system ATP-binding protein|nr:sugar ABC transporter ATP-binding protein [Synergistaceae bacterium]